MPTLDWLNRASAFTTAAQVPYRLLEQVSAHGTAPTDNLLLQGDNLEALKALLPFYRGQVKCIFIDPPYNTRSAFEHYDDNLEHAQWLSMMLPRLQLLRELLRDDGSIWVTIDDNEGHYLKVLMDEVFGRGNFVANVVWQKRTSPDNRLRLGDAHDHVLVFKKNRGNQENFNQLPINTERAKDFKNPDDDPRGAWASTDFTGQTGHATPNQFYTVVAPNGNRHPPPEGRCWALAESTFLKLIEDNRVWFGKDGSARPRLKRYLNEMEGQNAWSWWPNAEVGHNQEAKKEINDVFGASDAFGTPKPERLLQRILNIATNPNDLVLDSFLGSGTTAAVAHKMGRRWIGIEMGDHAATHCLPRLQKVIAGEQGGISQAVNWAGGGGFRFMRLGAPVFDAHGRIHPDVRFATLAAFIWQQETCSAWAGNATPSHPSDEANTPLAQPTSGTPHLGIHYVFNSCSSNEDQLERSISYIKTAQHSIYLLFNGILKDKRPASGNVLTQAVLDALLALHAQVHGAAAASVPLLVFGEACRLGPARLKLANVTFKHIPYDVKAR
ncbi:site-specific DNA-methyltransferase [Rhodoferax sp.]|uniref:site-specific DNA-methyltransferase n=1 Tax=Rhodoferax sp. TaxID=50421 RepID=UPI00262B144E|nr:site-specific DNA-methyltransferase [Rhodoferax sp.]MDD2810487.1 site-specific DNA-methyltransferase [Rhodoferax sp.]MDD4943388.1 site-specific DNA-methyltransferase [Rhodoferax sp.]